MKTISKIQIVLLSAVVFFTMAIPAYSALSTQTTSDEGPFGEYVDTKAQGTKMSGTLTLYHDDYGTMQIFLSLRKKKSLYGFSAAVEGVLPNGEGALDSQMAAVNNFIESQVIPELYCDYENFYDGTCITPLFAIKTVEEIVQDDAFCFACPDLGERNFAIMEIVIAVQD